MLTTLSLPAILLCASANALAGDWFAGDDAGQGGGMVLENPRNLLVAQNDGPSLGEAVEQVRRQYNGRIVSAETRMSGKREMHYIKVLTEDGKVKTVQVPGRTRGS
ncbi:MAG TPA: hypothetical protein VNQ14_03005 [Woeseiaceae bacterium]|nr:hypothetical protein [Woeseiaceae bacterium]